MVVSNGEAAVIDAVRTVEAYEEFAKEHGVTITNVMEWLHMQTIFLEDVS